MSRWFRFYDDVVNDPKVLKLSDNLFRIWVGILCASSKNDGLIPQKEDLAIILRIKPKKLDEAIKNLIKAELIDSFEGKLRPHNWDRRQFKSDVSTDRVQRHRNAKRNVSEAPPEYRVQRQSTEAQIQKDKALEVEPATPAPPTPKTKSRKQPRLDLGDQKHPSRLPANWTPSTKNNDDARREGLSEVRMAQEVKKFKNHWAAATKNAAKTDWDATWHNWCIKAAEIYGITPPTPPTLPAKAVRTLEDWKQILRIYASTNNWLSAWGPPPGEPLCLVPPELLPEEIPT